LATNVPLLNWLRFHQCGDDFVNSYQYVLLSENIRNGNFAVNIPLFILTEELKMEEETQRESLHIRELICSLLKRVENTNILYSNHNDALREFLEKRNMIPKGVTNPLLPNIKFYTLPTEVKMRILVQLIQHNGNGAYTPKHIGTDSHSNEYYIVGGRLYMKYGRILKEMTKDDNDSEVSFTSLKEYLKNLNGIWKCMATTEKMWKNIVLILENFDELNISKLITASQERAFEMIMTDEQERHKRREYEEHMKTLQPTPQPRRGSYDAPPSYEEAIRKSSETPILNSSTSREDKTRCMHFPCCSKKDALHLSTFHHPSEECQYFGTSECPGLYCRYKHPYCSKGPKCFGLECVYEHSSSRPTLLRIHLARREKSSGPSSSSFVSRLIIKDIIFSGTGRTRTKSFVEKEDRKTESNSPAFAQGRSKSREPPRDRPVYNPSNQLPISNKKDRRCHFFPRCNKREQCEFAHPLVKCTAFPNCRLGRDCPFKHGTCTKDGNCDNAYCPYEHDKVSPQQPPARYQGINGNRSAGMSRTTSISNLSMMSGELRR
ncbi:hypothetical protein PENTCL1PPCAC_24150, partial [Pristionchus entomophagus]